MNNRNLSNINKINSVSNINTIKLDNHSLKQQTLRKNSNTILRICPTNINKYQS